MADIVKISAEKLIEALKTVPTDVEVSIYKFDDGTFAVQNTDIKGLRAGRYELDPKGDIDAIIVSVRQQS